MSNSRLNYVTETGTEDDTREMKRPSFERLDPNYVFLSNPNILGFMHNGSWIFRNDRDMKGMLIVNKIRKLQLDFENLEAGTYSIDDDDHELFIDNLDGRSYIFIKKIDSSEAYIKELEGLNAELNSLIGMVINKQRFLDHDIRHMLSPISTGIDILKKRAELEGITGKVLEDLERLDENYQAFQCFVIDAFNIMDIERRVISDKSSSTDILSMIRFVQRWSEPSDLKHSKNLSIEIALPDDIPTFFANISPSEIFRSIINLVNNAIAYCEKDTTIIIDFKLEDEFFVINVINKGELDEEIAKDLGRLYKPSKRGSGLGLASVKDRLSKPQYAGKLEVSKLGDYIIFSIKLPRELEIKSANSRVSLIEG